MGILKRAASIWGNLRVGKPDVKPSLPSHTWGVKQGNAVGNMTRDPGQKPVGPLMAEATDRRSTGINPSGHHPIDPRMPKLAPP